MSSASPERRGYGEQVGQGLLWEPVSSWSKETGVIGVPSKVRALQALQGK